jgi:TM2 domain-containing membrane protein YozV
VSPQPSTSSAAENGELVLKDPATAAFLAWLIPGLGHLYQGRRAKGLLFMNCILGTFVYGLFLGEGRVVYAAWQGENKRWPYLCQVGVGLPALPALVQASRVKNNKPPLFNSVIEGFMAPPDLHRRTEDGDELDQLNKRLNRYFELGTVYTMIAGLLNVLAIYDAWLGPAYLLQQKKKEEEERESERPPPEPAASTHPSS